MATVAEPVPYERHHSSERRRNGFWRCTRCRTRLTDSLAIALHLGTAKASATYPMASVSVLGCTAEDIVFECGKHGLEAA